MLKMQAQAEKFGPRTEHTLASNGKKMHIGHCEVTMEDGVVRDTHTPSSWVIWSPRRKRLHPAAQGSRTKTEDLCAADDVADHVYR